MRVMAQMSMVMNLDKCIGCHTCSVTCKQAWTNRTGTEYVWFNNVETRPGQGYPRTYEDQERWEGGWALNKRGRLQLKAGGRLKNLFTIFSSPKMPSITDYYEPWTYDYENLTTAPLVQRPATLPAFLVLVGSRVALARPGLHVVEPDVLGAGAVRPRLLARHRAGMAADALVEVHHHRHLRHDSHRVAPPAMAGCAARRAAISVLHRLRATSDDGHLIALVACRAEVVEGVGQLGVPADEVARLDQQPGQRVVDAAALAGGLRARHVDQPVLGVVHVHRAFGHAVRDDGPRDDDAVAVDRLDPVVVLDPDLVGILVAHPDRRPTAGQREHEQVVLVLGVDRPLVVRGQVPHGDAQHARVADLRLAEERRHVQWRPEDGKVLTDLAHPVVVEVEVLAAGEGVPRLEPLDVDRER